MKWKLKELPKEGEVRVVNKFLIFPKCIDREVRWLERAMIRQRLMASASCTAGPPMSTYLGWCDQNWEN